VKWEEISRGNQNSIPQGYAKVTPLPALRDHGRGGRRTSRRVGELQQM